MRSPRLILAAVLGLIGSVAIADQYGGGGGGGVITSARILDETIVNADIKADAGIDPQKLSPGNGNSTELGLLNGHAAALVDVDDAVTTAITGTGALGAGSITSGFGAIDVGADNISTTGTVSAGPVTAAGQIKTGLNPAGTAADQAPVTINPGACGANEYLIAASVDGGAKFGADCEGDTTVAGTLGISGNLTATVSNHSDTFGTGSVILTAPAATSNALRLRVTGMAHGMTGDEFATTTEFWRVAPYSAGAGGGGTIFAGVADAAAIPAMVFHGANSQAAPTAPALSLVGSKKSGTSSRGALAATEKVLEIKNGSDVEGAGTILMTFFGDGTVDIPGTPSVGSCTLDGASPSVCTATVKAGALCTCASVGTTAAIAAQGCAVSVDSTTLTITSANAAGNVVNYHCF